MPRNMTGARTVLSDFGRGANRGRDPFGVAMVPESVTTLTVEAILVHPDHNHLRLFNLRIDGVTVRANVNAGSTGRQVVSPGNHTVGQTGARAPVWVRSTRSLEVRVQRMARSASARANTKPVRSPTSIIRAGAGADQSAASRVLICRGAWCVASRVKGAPDDVVGRAAAAS
jgi:hypothetical protein